MIVATYYFQVLSRLVAKFLVLVACDMQNTNIILLSLPSEYNLVIYITKYQIFMIQLKFLSRLGFDYVKQQPKINMQDQQLYIFLNFSLHEESRVVTPCKPTLYFKASREAPLIARQQGWMYIALPCCNQKVVLNGLLNPRCSNHKRKKRMQFREPFWFGPL